MAILHRDASLAPHNLGHGMTATAGATIFMPSLCDSVDLVDRRINGDYRGR
jgi:hypothetical protein